MTEQTPDTVRTSPEVRDALAAGRPVVALESTIISHGLPRPDNLRIAREIEQAVRDAGAVPATVAVVAGTALVGLDDEALSVIATSDDVVKVSVRDLGVVMARDGHGATTVAATSHLAALAGIRVFATGGLGGVHREARETWDESADLTTLAQTPITLVCAGVKSILDVPATLERLESLNIPVLGYRTDRFPGFYLADSGEPVPWTVDSADDVAAVMRARDDLGLTGGVVVAQPLPAHEELDRALHDRTLAGGLQAATDQHVRGKDVTPFLLAWFHEQTEGASLTANVRLVL
ncbi:MAG TPA: pseudouridine-5'-phosphate glycosidase, partial [Candidatus Nanopelagicales bacterium]